MQKTLDLKTYTIPESFSSEAKEFINDLILDMELSVEKLQSEHKEHVSYLKQQFKMAIRAMRPGFISPETMELLFDEAEMTSEPESEPEIEDNSAKKPKKKRNKKRKAIPDHLPRTVVEHDIADKICPKDGSELKPMGYDSKEELKFIPAKFEVIEHRFLKYSCPCCKEGVHRKEPSPALIPQSYASTELLAYITMSKYCNHIPLYRQEQIFAREQIFITRQVMSQWMIALGVALNPLIGIMHEKILEATVVSADETPVRILTKDGVRTSKQAYMWQISRWGPQPLIIFEYDQSRKKEVAAKLLGSFAGYVQIDGYSGYDILFKENSPRIRVGCLAHCLRKFKEFVKTLPKEQRKCVAANKIIKLIDDLYDIEKPIRYLAADERLLLRKASNAAEIFDQLTKFVSDEMETVSKESPYYTALRYSHEELPSIKNYLSNGSIEIDNNLAENAIRPFALGRRNWLFICTERGAQASANIYSLLITAKANGLEPFSYLCRVIDSLPLCNTLEDYEKLLPGR